MKYNNNGCEIIIAISLNFILFLPCTKLDNIVKTDIQVIRKNITDPIQK